MRKPREYQTPVFDALINMARIIPAAFLILVLSSCATTRGIIGSFRSTAQFKPIASDGRILYEPGAEAFANKVAPFLPGAIKKVEEEQYLPFHDPVRIYVCASADTFYKLTGTRAAADTTTSSVFLSPALFQGGRPVDHYLTHELSHLQLLQRLGKFKMFLLPAWFKEGLAETVSGGATGMPITAQEAYKAITEGHSFIPDSGRNIISTFINQRYGNYWKIGEPMFYRQSMLFVEFMKKKDGTSFKNFLLSVEHGESFSSAVRSAYHERLSGLWGEFTEKDQDKCRIYGRQTGKLNEKTFTVSRRFSPEHLAPFMIFALSASPSVRRPASLSRCG